MALATATEPLPGVSYATIDAALVAMAAVLNCLEGHYWHAETIYEHAPLGGGEADSMVYYLSEGVRAAERFRERWQQGKLLPEDSEPRH